MQKQGFVVAVLVVSTLFAFSACTSPTPLPVPNTLPVISQTDAVSVFHNTLAAPEEKTVTFTVSDAEDVVTSLIVSAKVSDETLVTLANPICNELGQCTLTMAVKRTVPVKLVGILTVKDTRGSEAKSSFEISVGPEEKNVASGADLKALLESTMPGASLRLGNTQPILLDAQIVLDKELTLWGLGQEKTILDAQNLDRHFWIKPAGKIILHDLTLTNGNAKDDGGTVEDDFIGGAIFNEGTLTLEKVRIISSRAVKGGGIYTFAMGETKIVESIIGQENASNVASRSGGGLFNDGGKLEVTNSQIVFNYGQERGGGIHNLKTTALTTLTDSTVSNNLSLDGAAIKNEQGQLIIRGSTLENNRATDVEGGAIFNADRLEIYSSVLRNNIAVVGAGGAIYSFGGKSSVLLDAVTLENNQSAKAGGGLASDTDGNAQTGPVIIRNGTKIIGNKTSARGGGIFNAGNLTITDDCQISANQAAENGGGLFITDLNKLVNTDLATLESVVINNNQPDDIATPPTGLSYVARTGEFVLVNKTY
jgi:hypothetical protein